MKRDDVIRLRHMLDAAQKAIGLESILIAESFFLINFDVAYWVYVYRIQTSSFNEDVELNLNPLDGWGLN